MDEKSWRDYPNDWMEMYNNMDVPTLIVVSILLLLIILMMTYIMIEVVTRRDITIMTKSAWSLSFMTMPGLSHLIYMLAGERENIDDYGNVM